MKKNKPYFTVEQVNKLVDSITTEMTLESKQYDENTVNAIKNYVQAPKNAYENSILSGVMDGIFSACILKKEMAYKIVRPDNLSGEQLRKELHNRSSRLSHAMNMITLYGKSPKIEV